MAHPDPKHSGAERDPQRDLRRDAGQPSADPQHRSPGRAGTHAAERRPDDITQAPESGEKPEVMPPAGTARR